MTTKKKIGIAVLVAASLLFVVCMILCELGVNAAIFWLYVSMPLFLVATILMRPAATPTEKRDDDHKNEYHE